MNETKIRTVEDIRRFLDGTVEVEFAVADKAERLQWMQRTLVRFRYLMLGKSDRGLVRRYLERLSGYSRAQVTRHIEQYVSQGKLLRHPPGGRRFQGRYTALDVALLVETDRLHGQLCGAATKKICERMYTEFKDTRYARLAGISISHLYNLRRSQGYRRQRLQLDITHAVRSTIGERRCPAPEGRPGYLRIDTVHQGDLDGIKGVYHINAVDAVTQYQCVFSVERISERFLLPVLKALIVAFPFVIQGIHADNGSEYINHQVAKLLEKLRIELTKSRARHSNDNALAECKNGVVIRKHLGYAHIPGTWATELNAFHRRHFNPYLNFHRPCFFALTQTDAKGKVVKTYRYQEMMTPYEKLKSLPNASAYLRAGVCFEQLDAEARAISDNEAARRMNEAKARLFKAIFDEGHRVA